MDKKDPIQQAKEEYARLLKEKINQKKSELSKSSAGEPDLSDAMSEFFSLAEQKQREEKELLRKKKILEEAKRKEREEKERQLMESKERPEPQPIVEQSVVESKSERDTLIEALAKLEQEKTASDPMDRYVQTLKDDRKKVDESANLMGGDETPVSRKELQALKTSLASLGGGGLGERDVIQLIQELAPGGGGSDSGGLDSQQILDLLGLNQGDTIVINQGDSINNLWQIINVDSNSQIITIGGDSTTNIWNILNIDSSDTILTINNLDSYQYTDSDVISLLNDSGVQNILPQLDSAFDLGDSARRWKDLWLSGNTIHLGDVDVSSVGDSGVGVYANGRRLAYLYETDSGATGGVDSAYVAARIDSALDSLGLSGYSTADHDSDTLVQVDSAYVQARVTFPVDNIDSAYVAARIDSALDSLGAHYTTADHDSDTLVQVDSAYVRARVKTDQNLSTTDIVTFDQVYANLDGAIEFKANNRSGATLLKGQPVYIDGIDGNKPTVALADANDPNKMPAYGLILEDANDNADCIVVTFGSLKDVDTSAFNLGDTLYIGTTPGELVSTPPAGTNSLIQNIGRVIRSHGSAGSIKVGGAGRSNATPNLSAGQIFYGNDSDRAVAVLATTVFDSDYINSLVDQPYLHELQDVQIDSTTLASDEFLQWNGSVWTHRPLTIETSLQFKGSLDVTADSAPTGVSGALYVNTGTGVALGSYTGVAGDSFQSGQTIAWSDSDNRWYQMGVSTSGSILEVRAGSGITVDDSDAERPVVSVDRATTDQWYLDSAEAIILIDERIPVIVDSAYVNLRADHYTRTMYESDTLDFVDSNYITARADGTYVNVTGDSMTGTLVLRSGANLNLDSGNIYVTVGNISAPNGYVQTNTLKSVGNSNIVVERNNERRMLWGTNDIIADKKIKYNSGYNRDSYTSDLVGVDSYTLMPKWYIDSATSEDYVRVAGDSMTGKLFAPAIQVGPASAGVNSAVLEFRTSDSIHELEVKSGGNVADVGATDFDGGWLSAIDTVVARNNWNGMAYDGSGRWVAVSSENDQYNLVYSDDGGITWNWSETTLSPPTPSGHYSKFSNVIYANNKFYAVGSHSSSVTTVQLWQSTDGKSWTATQPFSDFGVNDLASDGSTLVVVMNQTIEYSTNGGSTFTTATVDGGSHWRSVEYGNGVWIAVSVLNDTSNGPRITRSTDGQTWTQVTGIAGDTTPWYDVNYGDGTWVAVGQSGKTIYSTDDGLTWTAGTLPHAIPHQGVVFGSGVWMASGYNGSNTGVKRVSYSEDGITWTSSELDDISNTLNFARAIGYGGGRFILSTQRSNPQFIVLEHSGTLGGLFFDGSLVATKSNLEPVFNILNSMSVRLGAKLHFQDSDPAVDDSAAEDNLVEDTHFWYNTGSATLSIRDSGSWQAIGGGGSSLNNTDSLPEGSTNLYYTTARHDSDTLAQVDSAYVQARVNAAGITNTDSLPEGSTNLYYTTARHDSDTLAQVDSAYVQARIGELGGDSGYLPLSGGTLTGDFYSQRKVQFDSGGIHLGLGGLVQVKAGTLSVPNFTPSTADSGYDSAQYDSINVAGLSFGDAWKNAILRQDLYGDWYEVRTGFRTFEEGDDYWWRVNTQAISPHTGTMLLGDAFGFIWRSTDDGNSWQAATDSTGTRPYIRPAQMGYEIGTNYNTISSVQAFTQIIPDPHVSGRWFATGEWQDDTPDTGVIVDDAGNKRRARIGYKEAVVYSDDDGLTWNKFHFRLDSGGADSAWGWRTGDNSAYDPSTGGQGINPAYMLPGRFVIGSTDSGTPAYWFFGEHTLYEKNPLSSTGVYARQVFKSTNGNPDGGWYLKEEEDIFIESTINRGEEFHYAGPRTSTYDDASGKFIILNGERSTSGVNANRKVYLSEDGNNWSVPGEWSDSQGNTLRKGVPTASGVGDLNHEIISGSGKHVFISNGTTSQANNIIYGQLRPIYIEDSDLVANTSGVINMDSSTGGSLWKEKNPFAGTFVDGKSTEYIQSDEVLVGNGGTEVTQINNVLFTGSMWLAFNSAGRWFNSYDFDTWNSLGEFYPDFPNEVNGTAVYPVLYNEITGEIFATINDGRGLGDIKNSESLRGNVGKSDLDAEALYVVGSEGPKRILTEDDESLSGIQFSTVLFSPDASFNPATGIKMKAGNIDTIERIDKGRYRLTFNQAYANIAGHNYTAVATIDAQTDYTLSARTVSIRSRSNEGFEILCERSDTGANTDDLPFVSIQIMAV